MKFTPLFVALLGLVLNSCNSETSLQEYYVQNQQDNQFMALDVPSSLLTGDNSDLTAEQKATLKTINKVNFLAFPLKEDNKEVFEAEKEKITKILSDEKYQTLMMFGKGTTKGKIMFLGEDDAIDEFIIFGSDEEKGFGVARVTGNNMKPEDLIKLFKSAEKGDLDIAGLQDLLNIKQ